MTRVFADQLLLAFQICEQEARKLFDRDAFKILHWKKHSCLVDEPSGWNDWNGPDQKKKHGQCSLLSLFTLFSLLLFCFVSRRLIHYHNFLGGRNCFWWMAVSVMRLFALPSKAFRLRKGKQQQQGDGRKEKRQKRVFSSFPDDNNPPKSETYLMRYSERGKKCPSLPWNIDTHWKWNKSKVSFFSHARQELVAILLL